MNILHPILILFVAFIAAFLEAAFDWPRRLFGAQIDLLPSLMVYAALSSNLITITTLAVTGGLFMDSLSANPLGVSVFPLFVAGMLISRRRELILREQLFAQCVLGFSASAMVPLLTLFLLLSTRNTPVLGWGTLWQWFVMSLGGAIFAPLWFLLFDGLNHSLAYRVITETSFRPDREIRRGRS